MAKEKVVYTEEQKAAVLAQVETDGIHKAAKAAGIPWQTVTKWAGEAGLKKAKDATDAAKIEAKRKTRATGRKVKEAAATAVETAVGDAKEAADEAKLAHEMATGKAKAKRARKTEERKEKAEKAKESAKKPVRKAQVAKVNLVLQSPMGGAITPEEIVAKLPKGVVDAYVRIDQNKIYWVSKDETGSVEIW